MEVWAGGQKRKPKEGDPPRQPEQGLSLTTPTRDFELHLAPQRGYQFKKKKKKVFKVAVGVV